jgi:hypothetical protein
LSGPSGEARSDESDVAPGDVVVLRKPHPCGSSEWVVTRIGADIGLRCVRCDRTVMLPRHEFRTRLHHVVRRADR